jgi:large subunit ribosomal protein L20
MARVKAAMVSRHRHKKVLRQTSGMYGSRHLLFRRANEALMKSLWYAYRDRRTRKRDLRRLWIARINAGARLHGTSYSRLMHDLKAASIDLNRKMLADLAVRDPGAFAAIVAASRFLGLAHLRPTICLPLTSAPDAPRRSRSGRAAPGGGHRRGRRARDSARTSGGLR